MDRVNNTNSVWGWFHVLCMYGDESVQMFSAGQVNVSLWVLCSLTPVLVPAAHESCRCVLHIVHFHPAAPVILGHWSRFDHKFDHVFIQATSSVHVIQPQALCWDTMRWLSLGCYFCSAIVPLQAHFRCHSRLQGYWHTLRGDIASSQVHILLTASLNVSADLLCTRAVDTAAAFISLGKLKKRRKAKCFQMWVVRLASHGHITHRIILPTVTVVHSHITSLAWSFLTRVWRPTTPGLLVVLARSSVSLCLANMAQFVTPRCDVGTRTSSISPARIFIWFTFWLLGVKTTSHDVDEA